MKKNNYFLNFALIGVITFIALWFALKDNYQIVFDAIQQMSIGALSIVLVWGFLFTCVSGCCYYVLGKKYVKNYSILKGIVVSFTGTFFSGITPSSTGGQFGQAYIMRKQGIEYSDGASLLWADFIIYQTTMMLYVTALFLMKFSFYQDQSGWFNLVLAGYFVNAVIIISLYTMAFFPNLCVTLSKIGVSILSKLKILKEPEKTLESWTFQVTSFTKEIKKLSKDKKVIVKCIFINIVRLTLFYSLPYIISICLHIPVRFEQLLDIMALSSFVTMANCFIPIPGSSGGTEMMFTILFSPLTGTLTSAVMLLWRVSTYHIILLFGGLIFTIAKMKYSRQDEKEGN